MADCPRGCRPAMMTRRGMFLAALSVPLALPQRRRGEKPTGAGGDSPEQVLLQFPGTLRSVTKKQLLLDVGNEQELIFRLSKKTRFFDGEKEAKEEAAPVGEKVV